MARRQTARDQLSFTIEKVTLTMPSAVCPILTQHRRFKFADAVGACHPRQMLQQQRPDAVPLMRIADRKRDLGTRGMARRLRELLIRANRRRVLCRQRLTSLR